jgi:hypothetical protein
VLEVKMQIDRFARIAQIYAVPVSEFVRNWYPSFAEQSGNHKNFCIDDMIRDLVHP